MSNPNDEKVFGYESALNRFSRLTKWLIIVIVILIVALVGTNLAWIIYENQFETETIKVEQEADMGNNNFIGEDGIVINH